jgi:hypothetical protein
MAKEKDNRRLDIRPTQVIAAALAAVTAAFLGSTLGVAGTVIGTGIASLVSTVGSALYQHSLDRTGHSLRSKVASVRAADSTDPSASAGLSFPGDDSPRQPEPTTRATGTVDTRDANGRHAQTNPEVAAPTPTSQ